MLGGGRQTHSDTEIQETFGFDSVLLRRAIDVNFEPGRQILLAAGPGSVVVVAVASLLEVADRFGMQGLRDTAKFLSEYVRHFVPRGAQQSHLAWSVAFVSVPASVDAGSSIDFVKLRELVRSTDLELERGEAVRLELAIGIAPFDGVRATEAIDDAVREANVDLMARVRVQDGEITVLDKNWRPHFPAEFSG